MAGLLNFCWSYNVNYSVDLCTFLNINEKLLISLGWGYLRLNLPDVYKAIKLPINKST
jgi:hypothetical protein